MWHAEDGEREEAALVKAMGREGIWQVLEEEVVDDFRVGKRGIVHVCRKM